jgi:hypothetical protein
LGDSKGRSLTLVLYLIQFVWCRPPSHYVFRNGGLERVHRTDSAPRKSAAIGENILSVYLDEPIEHDDVGNANADASDEDKYRRDQMMTAKAGDRQSLLMCAVVLLACS